MADYSKGMPKSWWQEDDKHSYAKYQKSKVTPEELVSEMSHIKEKIAALELDYSKKNKELLDLIKDKQIKSITFFRNGRKFVAKLVEGTRTVVNEDKLKELIPASVWEKILNSKVDQTKLTRAITAGDIDAESVAEAVAIVPSSPYWRFSEKDSDDLNP